MSVGAKAVAHECCEMCGNYGEHRNPVIPHRNATQDESAWFWVCGRCEGVVRDRVRNVAHERRPLLAEPRPIWKYPLKKSSDE